MVKESLDNKAKGVAAVLDKMAANAWVVKFGDKEYRFSDEFTARKTYDDAVSEHQADPDMYVALYDPSGVLILDEGEISKANKEADKPAAPVTDKPAAKDAKTPAKPAQKAPPSKVDVDKAYVKEMPAWAQVDELLDEKGATSVDPVLARAEIEQLKIDREQFEEGTPEYEAATKKIDFATRKLMASVNDAHVRKTAELKEDISKRLDEFHDKLQKGKVEAELTDAERAELAAKKEAELRERERNLDKKP